MCQENVRGLHCLEVRQFMLIVFIVEQLNEDRSRISFIVSSYFWHSIFYKTRIWLGG